MISDQFQSVSGTIGHDLHKLRRNALSKFFSKASITRLEPLIVRNVQLLCNRIEQYRGSNRPVPLSMAFSCLSTDIAAEYAFSTSYNFLQVPDFQTPFYRAFAFAFRAAPFVKHIPWIVPLMEGLPRLVPPFLPFRSIKVDAIVQVLDLSREFRNRISCTVAPGYC